MIKKTTKHLLTFVLCFCCIFLFRTMTVDASMVDEAEDYELETEYSGHIDGSVYSPVSRYYKFTINEKSHVTLNTSTSSNGLLHSIYDSNGKIVLNESDLTLDTNSVTGLSTGSQSRILPAGTYILMLHGHDTDFTFSIQAEKQIKLPKGTCRSLKSKKKAQMTVTCKVAENAIGYRIQYSTDYRFKKNVKTIYSPTTTKTITELKKGQRYYVKVCPYTVYDDGTYVYGQNSYVKAVTVKKK